MADAVKINENIKKGVDRRWFVYKYFASLGIYIVKN